MELEVLQYIAMGCGACTPPPLKKKLIMVQSIGVLWSAF